MSYTHTWTFAPRCDQSTYSPIKAGGICDLCDLPYAAHPVPVLSIEFGNDPEIGPYYEITTRDVSHANDA